MKKMKVRKRKGLLLGFVFAFVFFLTPLFLLPVDAARALYAVEPVTSHVYIILLDVPADTDLNTLRPSLPGKFSVDEEGKYFLYVSPQEVLGSNLKPGVYLLKAGIPSQELPLNPDTGVPYAPLTEEELSRLGLRASFGVIGFLPEESPEERVEVGFDIEAGSNGITPRAPQAVLAGKTQQQNPQWAQRGWFLLPAALFLILIFYILWMRKKPSA